MKLLDSVQFSMRSISGNWVRAILTLLIIAIGIMALVGILTAIDGIKGSINSNFASMGANSFDIIRGGTGIRIGKRGKRVKMTPLLFKEVKEFQDRLEFPADVSISTEGNFIGTVQYQDKKTNPNIQVKGTDHLQIPVAGQEIGFGRNFTSYETENGSKVAIIGVSIAKKLFLKPKLAVDKIVRVDDDKYKVVGVLDDAGSSGIFSNDNLVFLTYQAVRENYPSPTRNFEISVAVSDPTQLEGAISEATGLFRSIRRVPFDKDIDFEISKSDMLAGILLENTASIRMAASVIGIITLLGAAIGLMNIMLVSVTERTREIGISKAIGANDRSILFQFLTEAVLICLMGGIVGIVLGVIAGNGVAIAIGGPFIMPWKWIFMGLTFCVFVGLISGIYPALKASNLDPIESLRHE